MLLAVPSLAAASPLPLPALGLAAMVPLRSAPAPVFAFTGLSAIAGRYVLISFHPCVLCTWPKEGCLAFRLCYDRHAMAKSHLHAGPEHHHLLALLLNSTLWLRMLSKPRLCCMKISCLGTVWPSQVTWDTVSKPALCIECHAAVMARQGPLNST